MNFPHLKVVETDVFNAQNSPSKNLRKVVLSSVIEIKDNAFGNQPNIESIEFGSVIPKITAQAFAEDLKSKKPTLFVPADAVSAYTNSSDNWIKAFKVEPKK